ncbi:hypothetical protein Tco_0577592 [Tanacetum coccineum]
MIEENGTREPQGSNTSHTNTKCTTTQIVTEHNFQALIDQGVAAAMHEAKKHVEHEGSRPGLTLDGFENIVYVFSISNCTASCQVNLQLQLYKDDALTGRLPILRPLLLKSHDYAMGTTLKENDDWLQRRCTVVGNVWAKPDNARCGTCRVFLCLEQSGSSIDLSTWLPATVARAPYDWRLLKMKELAKLLKELMLVRRQWLYRSRRLTWGSMVLFARRRMDNSGCALDYIWISCIKDFVALHFVYLLWAGNLCILNNNTPQTLIPLRPNLEVLQLGIKSQDTVMSDSDDSTVTYTEVSSPFEGLSDIRSPGVVGPEHEGLPWMLDDPYVQVFLAEEQPLPAAASPTAQSPDYVLEFDPEEDPEEDDDEDPEEDPVDYPADGGDNGDEEDESLEDDKDEEVIIETDDEEEEEEHPAPVDSTTVALPAIDQASSAEETELFETDESAATPPPHLAYRVTARISIPAPVSTPAWSDSEILSLPLPPILSPLPVSSLLPVSPPLPHIPLPPLPVSSPVPVLSPSPPASPIRPSGYRAGMIWLRAEAASTSHSLPLPPPIILSHTRPDAPSSGTPPLHLLSTDRREDRPEVTLPPRKRLGIALGPRYEVGESSSATAARTAGGLRADYGFFATMDREIRRDLERDVGYRITDSWDEIVEAMQGTPVVIDVAEFSQKMTEFETRVRRDTDKVYTRLDDEQTG